MTIIISLLALTHVSLVAVQAALVAPAFKLGGGRGLRRKTELRREEVHRACTGVIVRDVHLVVVVGGVAPGPAPVALRAATEPRAAADRAELLGSGATAAIVAGVTPNLLLVDEPGFPLGLTELINVFIIN